TNLQAIDGGAISLVQSSATLLTGEDTDGHPVFTIEIVNVGTVDAPVYQLQTTLYEPLVHGNEALFDEAVSLLLDGDGAVQLQYQVTRTDADGDSVTESATVDLISGESSYFAFEDDGPSIQEPECAEVQESANFSTRGVIEADFGTDGAGGFDLTGNQGLTADGLYYDVVKVNGVTTLTATVGNPSGEVFFILTVYDDPNALGDGNNYELTIVNPRPVTIADFDLQAIDAGSPEPSFVVDSGEGLQMTLTGSGLVNPSTQGVGVGGNNLINEGELLHMAFSEVVYAAIVDVQKLSNGDQLFWQAFDASNNLVAAGTYDGQGSESSEFSFNLADSFFTYGTATELAAGIKKLTFGSNDGDYRIQEVALEQQFLPPDLDLQFQIDVVDADGDRASTSLEVCFVDDVPVGGNFFDQVDEEGLANGIIGGPEDDEGMATTTSGLLGYDFGDDGVGGFEWLTAGLPNDLTSGGAELEYVVSGNGLVLTAQKVGSGEDVFTVTVTNLATGAFKFELLKPLDHPAPLSGSVENNIDFQFSYELTDSNGSEALGTLNISVDDDSPVAGDLQQSREVAGDVNTNLLIVLDVSGSMNSGAGFGGYSRLEAAKLAVVELLEQYEAMGDVKVRLVTFSNSAASFGTTWLTVAAAKEAVLDFPASADSATTNYDAAITTAVSAWASGGKLALADNPGEPLQNVSYFLSDGIPNQPSGSVGISPTEEANWVSFLNGNGIKSYALGMGPAAEVNDNNPPGNTTNNDQLDPIAYDGSSSSNTNAIAVNDFADLEDVLVQTVQATPISGSLIDGANGFGADGGRVKTVTVNGVTYTYDPQGVPPITGGNGTNFNTSVLSLTLAAGALLVLNMANGEYTYTPPANVGDGIIQNVVFSLIDNDDDATPEALLSITVNPGDSPMLVRDDYVVTNQADFSIPEWALLANDSVSNGALQAITAIQSLSGLASAAIAGGQVNVVDSGSGGGSFVYLNQAGSQSDIGNVDITRDSNGSIDGTFRHEILISGSSGNIVNGAQGNDILFGNGGADTLNGGDGDDLLIGGIGDDNLNGGPGNDVYLFSLSSDGADSIDAGSGNDAIVVQANAGSLVGLNFRDTDSGSGDGDLVIAFNGQQITVGNHFDGNPVESLSFSGGAKFGSYVLSADLYSLVVDDDNSRSGTGGNDILAGDNNGETLNGGDGHDLLFGNNGGDTLLGGAGDDLLVGGSGNDTMDGGAGADTFLWLASDLGGTDTINNFNRLEDVLDLSQILTGVAEAAGTLDAYLSFSEGNDTSIGISTSAGGAVVQTVVLDGVNLNSLYGAGDLAKINGLLGDGALTVDTV
ncbi:type I secretion C-terminal target domain-containing protein, partial [Pseudomonas sp. CrR25]|nr:type I secretion C-terminal target domain-containing protein [Pseudomonas sp. CrR25]